MLRPLLEQAADPLHQLQSGGTPFQTNQFSKRISNQKEEEYEITSIPTTVVLFKPEVLLAFLCLFLF